VPRFEPFRALRFAPGSDLDAELAPPYDVQSAADTDALAARDPHNIVLIDVPRPSDGDDPYAVAAARLRDWIAEGVLVADTEPSFTIYRMRFTDPTGAARDLAGVLGALEVVDEGAGGVLPHERTTPKASTDRLDLTRATRANLSPVWGLALAHGLTEALRAPGEPVGRVVVDGVEHLVERVTDPRRIAAIAEAVRVDDVLIADGHHRYGVARIYRDEVRGGSGHGTGHTGGEPGASAAELTLAYVGELVADQLSIDAIHRLYTGIDHVALRAALADSFSIEAAPAPAPAMLSKMVARGALVLLAPDGSAEWLTPRPGVFDGVRALDGAWLEHALDGVPVAVSYQHGLDEVVAAVTGGAAQAAVLIRPVSIEEIELTARQGVLMPPKSTFFTPKLLTGLVVRDLRG